MTDELKQWYQDLGSSDGERLSIVLDLLVHASEDEMDERDIHSCLLTLNDVTAKTWGWSKRTDSRSLDRVEVTG